MDEMKKTGDNLASIEWKYIFRGVCACFLSLLATLMFFYVWYGFVKVNNHTRFMLGYGNLSMVALIYLGLYVAAAKGIRAFAIGVERIMKILASQWICLFVVDMAEIFISMAITNQWRYVLDFLFRYSLLWIVQSVLLGAVSIMMVFLYRNLFPPIDLLEIYGHNNNLRNKVGLDIDGVNTNRHSDLSSNAVYKGLNPEERDLMQKMVERGYDLFTSRCAAGRHMPQDSIKAIGEGRVWLGKDAKRLGLVDAMGNIDNAVEKAAALAHLDRYKISYYPEVNDPIEEMLESLLQGNPTEEEKLIIKLRNFCQRPRVMALRPEVKIR